jgi:hypothetical protein
MLCFMLHPYTVSSASDGIMVKADDSMSVTHAAMYEQSNNISPKTAIHGIEEYSLLSTSSLTNEIESLQVESATTIPWRQRSLSIHYLRHNNKVKSASEAHRILPEMPPDEVMARLVLAVILLLLFCAICSCLCSCCCRCRRRRNSYYNNNYNNYNTNGGRSCLCDCLALLCLWEICCPPNDCPIVPDPCFVLI